MSMVSVKTRQSYSDELKLEVVREAFKPNAPWGHVSRVKREYARKYGIKGKSYLHNWRRELINRGLYSDGRELHSEYSVTKMTNSVMSDPPDFTITIDGVSLSGPREKVRMMVETYMENLR